MANENKDKQPTLLEKNETAFLKKMITIHLKGKVSEGNIIEKVDNFALTVIEKKTLNMVDLRLQKQSRDGLKLLYKKFEISVSTIEQKTVLLQYRLSNEVGINFTNITFNNLLKFLVKKKKPEQINGWDFGSSANNGLVNQSFKFVNNLCKNLEAYKGVA